MFGIVFATIVIDEAVLFADTETITISADDLPFFVVRPLSVGLGDGRAGCTVLGSDVPAFAGQTLAVVISQLAIEKLPILVILFDPRPVKRVFLIFNQALAYGLADVLV